jgi:EAL domain-containing protein (putative c-di-GMP-specific phosphodiesterase class I)/ActR/RegA family two-component response regulator
MPPLELSWRERRLLLVEPDDETQIAYSDTLRRSGVVVDAVHDFDEAIRRLDVSSYGAILTDLGASGPAGAEMLSVVQRRGLDTPVVITTASQSLELAAEAATFGAYRYLAKPVANGLLVEAVLGALRKYHERQLRRETRLGGGDDAAHAELSQRLARALATTRIVFQAIVSWRDRRVYGYEALLRSDEPSLERPDAIFDAAVRLGKVHDVGRVVRSRVAAAVASAPTDAIIFMNLHPADLDDGELYLPSSPLSDVAPRVVLELTEQGAVGRVDELHERLATLRALGFRIAIDDLGAGYAGLTRFVNVEPDIVKLDMGLVREIDHTPIKQRVVRSIVELCNDAGALVIAEGIETDAERDTIVSLGGDLLQGYLFSRPREGFAKIAVGG